MVRQHHCRRGSAALSTLLTGHISMNDIERTSLDAHVSICELRYQALNDHLDHMTKDMDELKSLIQGLHRDLDRQQDQTMNHWHRAQWAVIGVLLSSVGWFLSQYFA